MKQSIVVLCLMFGFSGAFAVDKSGFFVGAGAGIQGAKQEIKAKMTQISTGFSIFDNTKTQSKNDASLSLLVGYKIMNAHSGVRFYLNYDYNILKINQEIGFLCCHPTQQKAYKISSPKKAYQIIGLNADYLYDLSEFLGLFVGTNLGVISLDKYWDEYVAVQFGLRAFKERHSLEFGVKIPLTSLQMSYKQYAYKVFTQQDLYPDFDAKFEIKLKQQYNAFLRYVFSF